MKNLKLVVILKKENKNGENLVLTLASATLLSQLYATGAVLDSADWPRQLTAGAVFQFRVHVFSAYMLLPVLLNEENSGELVGFNLSDYADQKETSNA